ncbi:MAG: acyltransferase family protein [Arcicella sp.]|nr:acyltransferase family protein [Arcicella sp.]
MPKLYWITNLRVLATIFVVIIHTSGGILFHYNNIPHSSWWIGNIVSSFGRFAVPVFVMISGALLLGKEIELFAFLQKRFIRVWIPFTIWVIIYVLYHNIFENNSHSFSKALIDYLTMGGSLYGHLWFIYMILGLYLLTPFINHFLSKATNQEVNFFLLLCFISCSIFPLINKFLGIQIKLDLQNFGGYIGYFVAGYVLKNREINWNKWLYVTGFLVGYGIALFGNYWLILSKGKLDDYFYQYLTPNIILMSLSIFLFFKDVLNKEFYPSIMNNLDKASFGIYLSHYLIITILSHKLKINWLWNPPIIGILTHAGLTLIISFLLIWTLNKLPKSHWITG